MLWAMVAFACLNDVARANTVEYQGRAIDPSSGRLLYRETHLLQSDGERMLRRVVLYQCSNGDTFARKRVDYSQSQIAPAFELDDARDGYREGLLRENGTAIAFFKPNATAPERTVPIASTASLVADAGFDAFVTRNWTALAAGKTLALDFAIPARGKAYGFRLARHAKIAIDGTPAWTFRLQLGGMLAWFVSSIDVSYAIDSHRLLRFEGVTNIRSSKGGQMTARIDFPATAPKPIAAAALQDAMTQPLKPCTVAR
jgi:hypothetical protein